MRERRNVFAVLACSCTEKFKRARNERKKDEKGERNEQWCTNEPFRKSNEKSRAWRRHYRPVKSYSLTIHAFPAYSFTQRRHFHPAGKKKKTTDDELGNCTLTKVFLFSPEFSLFYMENRGVHVHFKREREDVNVRSKEWGILLYDGTIVYEVFC